jgi:DNA-binding XRE family transcriptional regulator
MNMPEPIRDFIKLIGHECEGTEVSVDSPRDPNGEYWLDISVQKFRTSVSFKPKRGFGVFVSDPEGYGERPDEIYARPGAVCARICQLVARTKDTRAKFSMHLRELRQIVGTSQVDLAAELDINQAAISRMENRADMHLSSLHEYVAAMGGELELRAKFKDFEARIEPVHALKRRG